VGEAQDFQEYWWVAVEKVLRRPKDDVLWVWIERPEKRWLTRVLVALFALAIALPLLGLLARGRGA
jgi:hypothetical protein